MSHPVLISLDFILRNNVRINGAKSEMLIRKSIVEFLPLWKVVPRVCTASLKDDFCPPRSEMTAIGKLEPARNYEVVPDPFDVVLEAREIFSNDEGLLIAHTAGTVRQGSTPVRIMNASESEVRLKGKSILGSLYAAMPESVKVARVGFYEFVEEKCDVSISMAQEAKPA